MRNAAKLIQKHHFLMKSGVFSFLYLHLYMKNSKNYLLSKKVKIFLPPKNRFIFILNSILFTYTVSKKHLINDYNHLKNI